MSWKNPCRCPVAPPVERLHIKHKITSGVRLQQDQEMAEEEVEESPNIQNATELLNSPKKPLNIPLSAASGPDTSASPAISNKAEM